MTREEAINMVQGARQYLTAGNPIWDAKKIDEAMSMAIEALSDRTGEWICEVNRMDDLISRQAAIEALHTRFKDGFNEDKWWNSTHVLAAIEGLPSAQPEIIRCKDCKHRYLDGMIWNCPFGLSGGEDFFCAYGAKEGDSDDE